MTSIARSASGETRLWRADHAGQAYNQDIEDCRNAVSEQAGLDYVAHVTYGIIDFALGATGRWPDGETMVGDVESAVRQLGLAVIQLDDSCKALDSGALIRVVLQGEHGALIHVVKVVGQNLFALTLDGAADAVDRVDERLARLAEASAGRIGGPSLEWGGFRDREDSGELWLPYESGPEGTGQADVFIGGRRNVLPGGTADACLKALDPRKLHYIAIFRRDELLWSADIFDTPELAPHFQRVSPAVRRRGYVRLLHQVDQQFRRFRQLLELAGSEHLTRLVLDVARGGIDLLPLSGDDFLVTVTLSQSQVKASDQKTRAVHRLIRPVWPAAGLSSAEAS